MGMTTMVMAMGMMTEKVKCIKILHWVAFFGNQRLGLAS